MKFPLNQSTFDLISDAGFNIKDEFISTRADSTLKIEFYQVSVAEMPTSIMENPCDLTDFLVNQIFSQVYRSGG